VGEVASIPNGSSFNLGAELPRTRRGPNLHEEGRTTFLASFEEVGTLRARPVIKVSRGGMPQM
jgi:hypothetical protein